MGGTSNHRVVVTGGKGFLGGFVCEELERRGFAAVDAVDEHDYDLTDAHAAEAMFAELRPRYLIHLAAVVGGIGANKANPGRFSYANSVMGANVLEGARRHRPDKVVVIGTACVYPANASVPTSEEQMFDGFPAEETAPYALAKRNLWMMGAAYRKQYGLSVVYLIPTNIYGPRDHFAKESSHVIPALIRRFVEAREASLPEVVIWGDGSATREFIYVEDAARGIVAALEKYDAPEPVNLGSGREVPIIVLAETIRELSGYGGRLAWDPTKPTGVPRRSLDVERARLAFGFSATTELRTGLARTIEWYEARR